MFWKTGGDRVRGICRFLLGLALLEKSAFSLSLSSPQGERGEKKDEDAELPLSWGRSLAVVQVCQLRWRTCIASKRRRVVFWRSGLVREAGALMMPE